MKHNTVVVNLVAGPSAGKTTCAWEIAAELKKAGLVVEYVPEVAKEYIWEGRCDLVDGTLKNQRVPEKFSDTISQVIAVTGYSDNSVDRWLSRGWLRAVQTQSGKRIPKEWLIDFYCGYGYTIAKMSERHIGLMRRFFEQQ